MRVRQKREFEKLNYILALVRILWASTSLTAQYGQEREDCNVRRLEKAEWAQASDI